VVTTSPGSFVRTVLRIIIGLCSVNLASNIVLAVVSPLWQNVAMVGVGVQILTVSALCWRTQRSDPARAIEQFYVGAFVALGLSILLVRGTHALVGLGMVTFVLSTAPLVLPLARVDRWAQATIAFAIVNAAFDIVPLPTQIEGDDSTGFTALVGFALAIFVLLIARNFRRYPIRTKLTLGFLVTATLPLFVVSYLRPLPAGANQMGQELLGLGVVGGAAALAFAVGRLLSRPLTETAEAMGRFTAGELSARARVSAPDEVGEVAVRFNALAEELGRVLGSLREEVAQRTQKEIELQDAGAALATARDQATAANRAKSAFLAQMSHELRTPLNAIIGYAELIGEEAGQPDVHEDAARILGAARHLLGIISDLLDLSRIEAGKLELALEEVDAVAVVRGACATVKTLMERSGDALDLVVGAPRLVLRADPRKLQQIVLNLLSNAAKFCRDARVTCEVRGEPAAEPEWIVISVRDEGIGIPADRLDTLFQPFVQVDSSPARRFQGTGLGLAISRYFCEAMGGTIGVESAPGRGSTFTVRLPVAGVRTP